MPRHRFFSPGPQHPAVGDTKGKPQSTTPPPSLTSLPAHERRCMVQGFRILWTVSLGTMYILRAVRCQGITRTGIRGFDCRHSGWESARRILASSSTLSPGLQMCYLSAIVLCNMVPHYYHRRVRTKKGFKWLASYD